MKSLKLKFKNYLFFFAILSILILPSVSLAQGLVPCGNPGQPACEFCHIFVLFQNVINFLLVYIVPPLAVLMLAIGGFMYVFAIFGSIGDEGGPALLMRARKLFTYTVIGLIVIYAAWLIVNLFFQVIGVAEWTGLQEGWWKIDCQLQNPSLNPPT